MMRYSIGIFLCFVCGLFLFIKADAFVMDLPLFGKIIYLDAGHGGKDPGAAYKDVYEDEINLEIVLKIRDELMRDGAIVYLTREGDYDLADDSSWNRKRVDLSRRALLINDSNCDLFISIHLNTYKSSTWKGAQVFYNDNNEQNKVVAEVFRSVLVENLNTDRKIKEMDDYYLFDRINRPGILLEVGFLSNYAERKLLQDEIYQQKVAVTVKKGVIKYFVGL